MTGSIHVALAALGAAIGVGLIGTAASDRSGAKSRRVHEDYGPVDSGHCLRGSHRLLRLVPRAVAVTPVSRCWSIGSGAARPQGVCDTSSTTGDGGRRRTARKSPAPLASTGRISERRLSASALYVACSYCSPTDRPRDARRPAQAISPRVLKTPKRSKPNSIRTEGPAPGGDGAGHGVQAALIHRGSSRLRRSSAGSGDA